MARSGDDQRRGRFGNVEALRCSTDAVLPDQHADQSCGKRPNIRRFEHFLQLLDVVNDAFNIHASQYPLPAPPTRVVPYRLPRASWIRADWEPAPSTQFEAEQKL
jgi:hypothetical protein